MRDRHDAGMTIYILYGWLVAVTALVALPISIAIAWRTRERQG